MPPVVASCLLFLRRRRPRESTLEAASEAESSSWRRKSARGSSRDCGGLGPKPPGLGASSGRVVVPTLGMVGAEAMLSEYGGGDASMLKVVKD